MSSRVELRIQLKGSLLETLWDKDSHDAQIGHRKFLPISFSFPKFKMFRAHPVCVWQHPVSPGKFLFAFCSRQIFHPTKNFCILTPKRGNLTRMKNGTAGESWQTAPKGWEDYQIMYLSVVLSAENVSSWGWPQRKMCGSHFPENQRNDYMVLLRSAKSWRTTFYLFCLGGKNHERRKVFFSFKLTVDPTNRIGYFRSLSKPPVRLAVIHRKPPCFFLK